MAVLENGWTVVTADHSDAAHFEHTVLISDERNHTHALGVTILDLDDFQTGRVVISRKERIGHFYAVIGMDRLKNRVYVADGRRHSVSRPKPKTQSIFR